VSRVRTIRYEFVEQVPRQMKARTLYISIEHGTCIHLCLCGCGAEVVTPLSPRQWALTYDGETVSLWPSVGSWHLSCQSHYIIKSSRVLWGRQLLDGGRHRELRSATHRRKPIERPGHNNTRMQ
jgi:hypothetical protein